MILTRTEITQVACRFGELPIGVVVVECVTVMSFIRAGMEVSTRITYKRFTDTVTSIPCRSPVIVLLSGTSWVNAVGA